MSGFIMEPMLPGEGQPDLEELAFSFTRVAGELSGKLASATRESLGELVRTMNCYYSNLIEGHQTLPRDIDSALKNRYSDEPKRRRLQEEAVAHIAVQKLIDEGSDPDLPPTHPDYLKWVHHEFCRKLPEEMLVLEHPQTGKEVPVMPGEFRQVEVEVGRHEPPAAKDIGGLLAHFARAYDPTRIAGFAKVTSIPAAHHRLLWIHPFADGNGRVARLVSHAMLLRGGFGSSLWSISRGLARNVDRYKLMLEQADFPRQGDLDGRGNLSLRTLRQFCAFYFEVCIDQVTFMDSLIQPEELSRRIRLFCRDEIDAGRLPNGSLELLMAAFTQGEVERGKVESITGYKERRARQILAELIQKDLLISMGPRKPVRLGFPLDVVERWLPALYTV